MVIPLSVVSLVQNIKFQLASVAVLSFILVAWIFIFVRHGFGVEIAAIGSNQSGLIGLLLSNFSFVRNMTDLY
jgi:hypothetical protein